MQMDVSALFQRVRFFLAALSVVATTALLVFTIIFTDYDLHWVTFLSGVLVASALSLASRATKADRTAVRDSESLRAVQEKLAEEAKRREAAEGLLAAGNARLQLLDNELPTMVAFVDREGLYRYHNRAFREGMRLKAEQLDGVSMRDVLGGKQYGEAAANMRRALAGESVRFARSRPWDDGLSDKLEVRYLPSFKKNGVVEGFFEVLSNSPPPSRSGDSVQASAADPALPAPVVPLGPGPRPEQLMYVDAFSENVTDRTDAAGRIVAAIEKSEFALLCQVIAPLAARASAVNHFEIFVRLMEEEDSLMPPGAFFPLAEKFGLLPRLDRWVVQHVIEWTSNRAPTAMWSGQSTFFINVARATICDTGFPDFVEKQLSACGVPGGTLCFEVTELDAASDRAAMARFAADIKRQGCLLALSGFGRESVSFDVLRDLKADFVKIDGSVILGLLRNRVYFARLVGIARVAKAIGVRSVAQLVESPDILKNLREMGIDFAQGIGIGTPMPLSDLESRKA
jgi:EAL domain-containing protein (putative c-di-GMP-specific phosphodiesterase class I)/PAS domain-containing protein